MALGDKVKDKLGTSLWEPDKTEREGWSPRRMKQEVRAARLERRAAAEDGEGDSYHGDRVNC